MMKAIRRLFNTIREGVKGIWKHKNLGFFSITSTFFTLFIIGIIIILSVTVNNIALQVQGKVNDVEIYIINEATSVQIQDLRDEIDEVDINKEVIYRSSEEALELMKASWGENADLLEGMEDKDLLPASFIVSLEDIDQADQFVAQIEDNPIIEDINYYKELVDQISKVSKYVELFGAILVIILIVVSIFIISNTIKLTVVSRVNEIAVMKNVGATNNYIRIPFLIEGVFFSLLAALLAYGAIYYLYSFVYNNFGISIADNFSIFSLINPEFYKDPLLKIFLALGIGIGVIGSVFSIRRYLLDREVNYVR